MTGPGDDLSLEAPRQGSLNVKSFVPLRRALWSGGYASVPYCRGREQVGGYGDWSGISIQQGGIHVNNPHTSTEQLLTLISLGPVTIVVFGS